jgi:large subunit ribosomal protein L22
MGLNAKIRKERKLAATPTTCDGRVAVSSARLKYAHVSARKMALVAGMIRNMPAWQALEALKYANRPSAVPFVERTLKSAIANAENSVADPGSLIVGEITVEGAPMMKRIRAASMGRAVRVRKRLSHLTITLTEN